ncbi:prenyltransferase/squalene oxidase repeat-containing protein [Prosthecobacter sp.]|uniref:prenyltransferase/squalene oxidase repeat-containing protein n=1 Tax=Prosthecobacter sp. TaxID=1965333 RepID=UPI002AB98BB4|nr:prenyltransferase/squalene oxidase repeat-containing protein [Prosthecobacter sp.]MDZ4402247.1 prenyltransferase/squalene oxidase repeat-containing protein [Prosthecobacter sp.]
MKTRLLLCLLTVVTTASAEEALEIVKRSLPFVKEKGAAWIADRGCASCHQVPSMLWSLNSAARAGIDPERKETTEWTPWAADWRHWNQSKDKDGVDKVSAGNIDTMVFLLLGRDAVADASQTWITGFREQLLKNQQPDGSWKPGGQLPLAKRPTREMSEVTTMWTLLALKSYGAEAMPPEVQKRAEDFLATAQPGKSTEWHAARLLLQPDDATRRNDLLKLQHPDGSWGWLASDPGDALGTGFAMYALTRSGLPNTHEAMQRAVAFLKSSQKPDGSWAVPSTRAKDKNKVIATSTYWGTSWATIGLLETLAVTK